MSTLRHVVVVGASLAGVRGAEELRRAGYDGALTLIGDEIHFPPIDRPPLSKEVLSSKWTLEEARLRLFEELRAELRLGEPATGLDLARRIVTLHSGQSVAFDGLMIATGASVRRLPCPGADLTGVIYLRDAEHCTQLQASLARGPRVVVIGAGFIGSEIAAVCRGLGLAVTMIDAASLPLQAQVGARMATYLMDQHRSHGVDLRLGVGITAVEGREKVERVLLADGSTVAADVVVAGIGVVPATQWLAGSGLTIDNGVQCDEHCRAVGAENVVAAGDVARWLNPAYGRSMRVEHWTNAVEQAEYAARALLGKTGAGYRSIPYFWSDQYDMHLQFAGIAGDTNTIVEGSLDDRKFVIESRTDAETVGVLAVNSVARFQRHRRTLTQARTAATVG
jgi:3-phenylpropionate/trans-cinnamate dioxygenase ferredoxin reductase component